MDIDECADASDDCLADEECQFPWLVHLLVPPKLTRPAMGAAWHRHVPNSFCVDTPNGEIQGATCVTVMLVLFVTHVSTKRLVLFSCDDIDECSNSDHSCHASSTCENTPGSYQCKCSPTEEMINDECIPIEVFGWFQCPENSECH